MLLLSSSFFFFIGRKGPLLAPFCEEPSTGGRDASVSERKHAEVMFLSIENDVYLIGRCIADYSSEHYHISEYRCA